MGDTTQTLNLRVVADASGLSAVLVDASGKVRGFGGEAAAAGQRATGAFDSITGAAEKLAAAVGIAFSVDKIAEFVGRAIDGASRIGDLAQSLGIGTQNLQAFNYVAATTGTTLDNVSGSLTRLEHAQLEARDGNAQTAEAFRAIGVSATDSAGKLKPVDSLIIEVAQHLAGMQDGGTKASIMMQLMGRGAAEAIPFFNALGNEFDKAKSKAQSLGLVLSAADQSSLVVFKERVNDAKEAVAGLSNTLAVALLPALTSIVGQFSKLAESGMLSKYIKEFGSAASVATDNVELIATATKTLVEIKLADWAIDGAAGLASMAKSAVNGGTAILSLKGATSLLATAIAGWNFGTYLSDNFLAAKQVGLSFVQAMLVGWENLKAGAKILWLEFQKAADDAFAKTKGYLSGVAAILSNLALMQGNVGGAQVLSDISTELKNATSNAAQYDTQIRQVVVDNTKHTLAIREEIAALYESNIAEDAHGKSVAAARAGMAALDAIAGQYFNTLSAGKPTLDDEAAAIRAVAAEGAKLIKSGADVSTVQAETAATIGKITKAYDAATRAQGNYNSGIDASKSLLEGQREALAAYSTLLNQISGQFLGPFDKALQTHKQALIEIDKEYENELAKQLPVAAARARHTTLLEEENKAYQRSIELITAQNDQLANAKRALDDQIALWNVAPEKQAAVRAGMDAYNKAMETHVDLQGHTIDSDEKYNDLITRQIPLLVETTQAFNDVAAAQQANEAINREWISEFSSGLNSVGSSIADFVTGGIKSWKDFGKSLLADTVQFINSIIQQFLRLTVFNGITNSLFGLTGSSALPTGLGNGLIGQLFSGASGGGGIGGAAGGAGFDLFSPSSWMDAGKNLFSGFWSGGGSNALDANGVLQYQPNSGASLASGGYSSGLGQALGIAGGVYAGYNRFQSAGGGAAGVAGGLAYGAGTYALGAGVSSALAGSGFAAGVGGAFAVPFIGWAALVAMVVDKFSGGKLFGTSFQTIGATSALNIGPDGSSAAVQLQQSKQSALFGGKKTRDKTAAATPEMVEAAAQLYDSYTQIIAGVAKQIGIDAPSLVAESLKTVQTFDKKGKVTGTSYETDVNGTVYKDATAELQQTRAVAEQIVATVSHSDIGKDAETIAQQWRTSADALMDGAQLLVQATADINNSQALLGDASTLADTVSEVQKLQGANESLAQTYVRLQVQTSTVRSILDNVGDTTSKTGAALVEFADDMVTAAGGLDQLNTLWNAYYQGYFSDSERAANKLAADQKTLTKLGADIGQDSTETMAQFRENFTAVFDSLSAADVVKWLQFASALGTVNADLGTTTGQVLQAQAQYDSFIGQFKAFLNPLTDFEVAMDNVTTSLAANVAQANALAVAAGKSGASIEDIGTIIQGTVLAGAQAFEQLESKIQAEATRLFGSDVDQLQKKLDGYEAGGAQNAQLIIATQKEIADAQARTDAASKLSDASALIKDLGQVGAVSGESFDEISAREKIPLDVLEQILGTNAEGLQAQYENAVDLAKASLDTANNTKYTNEILANMYALEQGKPEPFSVTDLIAALGGPNQAVAGDKPGARTAAPTSFRSFAPAQPPGGTAPPAASGSSGSGGDATDPGKQTSRVVDAVDGGTRAVVQNGSDVVTELRAMRREFSDLRERLVRFDKADA